MSVVDELIVGGGAPAATTGQAMAYLLDTPGRVLTDDECAEVVNAFVDWCGLVGVRWDVCFAQSCHETGRYTFTGDVEPEQHNPAGIGTTGGGVPGLTFPDWTTGIAAMVVHLLTWCGRDDLAHLISTSPSTLDPRVPLVQQVRQVKGVATTWDSLGGRWAVPGLLYGEGVARHYNAIVALPNGEVATSSPFYRFWEALWIPA